MIKGGPSNVHRRRETSSMVTAAGSAQRRWTQWSLRAWLLLFLPLCAVLSWYGHYYRQRSLNGAAIKAMCEKGVTANFADGLHHATFYFVDGNVTDEDLDGFLPAFNGYSVPGRAEVKAMHLCGSHVSPEALQRFRQAVPHCQVLP
jgi:hypothetical protein